MLPFYLKSSICTYVFLNFTIFICLYFMKRSMCNLHFTVNSVQSFSPLASRHRFFLIPGLHSVVPLYQHISRVSQHHTLWYLTCLPTPPPSCTFGPPHLTVSPNTCKQYNLLQSFDSIFCIQYNQSQLINPLQPTNRSQTYLPVLLPPINRSLPNDRSQHTSPSPSIRTCAIARIIVAEWIQLLHVIALARINLSHHPVHLSNLPVHLHRFEEVQLLASSSTSGSNCFTYSHLLVSLFFNPPIPFYQSSSINSKLCNCTSAINQSIATNFPIATYQYFSIDSKLCNRSYHRRRVDRSASRNCTHSYQSFAPSSPSLEPTSPSFEPTSPSPSIQNCAIVDSTASCNRTRLYRSFLTNRSQPTSPSPLILSSAINQIIVSEWIQLIRILPN
jgi:hypothetical protein